VKNLKKYGTEPYRVAVVHGGPGAAGQMAEVARELSGDQGVLEPLQTEATVDGQVDELKEVLEQYGNLPLKLVGHSWGAWLSYICAARYPMLVEKLILIGCGPFREHDARNITKIRLERLDPESREMAVGLMEQLLNPMVENKDEALARLGYLFFRADAFDPLDSDDRELQVSFDINRSVWQEAAEMRQNGELLNLGKRINCPVVAIHGDYDPHPAHGVETPLKKIMNHFQFILVRNCGHMPWNERQARDEFFDILRHNLA
jgi:pimeloyl-ACP methyl ester carboxylesterase